MAWAEPVPTAEARKGQLLGITDRHGAKSQTAAQLARVGPALVARRGAGSGDSSRVLVEFHGTSIDVQRGGRMRTVLAFHHRHDLLHGDGTGTVAPGVFQQAGRLSRTSRRRNTCCHNVEYLCGSGKLQWQTLMGWQFEGCMSRFGARSEHTITARIRVNRRPYADQPAVAWCHLPLQSRFAIVGESL